MRAALAVPVLKVDEKEAVSPALADRKMPSEDKATG
jgi:hypothetical protein